jgi:hypothetical protein
VLNSAKSYSERRDFASTPQAKAPGAWGLATPLQTRIIFNEYAEEADKMQGIIKKEICIEAVQR